MNYLAMVARWNHPVKKKIRDPEKTFLRKYLLPFFLIFGACLFAWKFL